jgi:hypothetical protein
MKKILRIIRDGLEGNSTKATLFFYLSTFILASPLYCVLAVCLGDWDIAESMFWLAVAMFIPVCLIYWYYKEE